MTVVSHTRTPGQTRKAREILRSMAQTQPARAIIIAGGDHPSGSGVEATLETKCHDIAGKRLCYEEITIRAPVQSSGHLSAAVLPLLVSHLPTCLWWMDDPRFSEDAFEDLESIADRVIVDSESFTSVGPDLEEV